MPSPSADVTVWLDIDPHGVAGCGGALVQNQSRSVLGYRPDRPLTVGGRGRYVDTPVLPVHFVGPPLPGMVRVIVRRRCSLARRRVARRGVVLAGRRDRHSNAASDEDEAPTSTSPHPILLFTILTSGLVANPSAHVGH